MEENEYIYLLEEAFSKVKRAEKGTRFEIPKVRVSNIKNRTIIENFEEIAKILRRDKEHLAKFLSKSIGAPYQINESTLIINKFVRKDFLQSRIEEYTKKFVLCKQCNNPDTKIEDKTMICEACGATNVLG